MKNLVILTLLLGGLFINRLSTAQEISIYDEYYSIHNGIVTEKVISQEQKKMESPADVNLYPFLFEKNLREFAVHELIDEKGYLTELTERKDKETYITHQYTYDNYGSIQEEKCTINSNNKIQTSLITYEYVYLDKFTHEMKNGVQYISGTEPDFSSFWVKCTIRRDGTIIQCINRKIRTK